MIFSFEILSDHVQVVADIDGETATYAMIPSFSDDAHTLAGYVLNTVLVPARLCVTHEPVLPANVSIPTGMAVIDMIVPQTNIPHLRASLTA